MTIHLVNGKIHLPGKCDRCQEGKVRVKTPSGACLCEDCVREEMFALHVNHLALQESVQRLLWAVAVDGARQDSEGNWHPRGKAERGPFESEEYKAAAQLGMVRLA
jgi:hypothetical protein